MKKQNKVILKVMVEKWQKKRIEQRAKSKKCSEAEIVRSMILDSF